MKYIQDTLNRQGQVKWLQGPRNKITKDAAEGMNLTLEVSEAIADSGACTVSFKSDYRSPDYRLTFAWKLPVRDIQKVTVESLEAAAERFRAEARLPEWGSTTIPTVFNLQVYASPNKKFQAHRWSINSVQEIIEKDQEQSPASVIFSEEETAQRIARAMLRAKELCSTSSKAPH